MREVIDKYSALPFDYKNDCCRFAAECIESQRGVNPIASLSYATEEEAYTLISRYGGLYHAIKHYLGEPYDDAKTGDVCLLDANDGTEAVGVIYRERVVARVKNGLMDYPLSRAKFVWCV